MPGNEEIRITQLCLTMTHVSSKITAIAGSVLHLSSVKVLNTEGSKSVEIAELTGQLVPECVCLCVCVCVCVSVCVCVCVGHRCASVSCTCNHKGRQGKDYTAEGDHPMTAFVLAQSWQPAEAINLVVRPPFQYQYLHEVLQSFVSFHLLLQETQHAKFDISNGSACQYTFFLSYGRIMCPDAYHIHACWHSRPAQIKRSAKQISEHADLATNNAASIY